MIFSCSQVAERHLESIKPTLRIRRHYKDVFDPSNRLAGLYIPLFRSSSSVCDVKHKRPSFGLPYGGFACDIHAAWGVCDIGQAGRSVHTEVMTERRRHVKNKYKKRNLDFHSIACSECATIVIRRGKVFARSIAEDSSPKRRRVKQTLRISSVGNVRLNATRYFIVCVLFLFVGHSTPSVPGGRCLIVASD